MSDLVEDIIGADLAQLPVVIRGGGYKQVCVGAVIRELQPKDILDLQQAHNNGLATEKRSLSKVRHNHHVIAQMLASGKLSYEEVSEISGYSLARISTLACDPTMQELIETYREAKRDIAIDLGARYKAIVGVATEEVMERLEDQPEEFTSMQLVDIAERLGDRCGMGPKSALDVRAQIGVLVTDATLESIKGAVDAASRGRVFQGQGGSSGGQESGVGPTSPELESGHQARNVEGPTKRPDLPAEGVKETGGDS